MTVSEAANIFAGTIIGLAAPGTKINIDIRDKYALVTMGAKSPILSAKVRPPKLGEDQSKPIVWDLKVN